MIYSPTSKDFRISQVFGGNAAVYAPFGLKGHNGEDIAVPSGTQLFSPISGVCTVGDQGKQGFGKYVRIVEAVPNKAGERREVTLAHLSKILIKNGIIVKEKQCVGLSGNTGFSTGAHLHWQLRRLDAKGNVIDYNNGFKGSQNIFGKGWIKNHDESVSKY